MYNRRILNLFAEPHNYGIIGGASGIGQYTNEKTNEVIKLYIKIENDTIINAGYKVYSGVVGIALMTVFTDMLKNKTIDEALAIKKQDVLNELIGIEQSQEYLADDALESLLLAVADYQKKLEKEAEKNKK